MAATAPVLEVPAPASGSPIQVHKTRVSLESYLNTDYSPDVDWLDGELKERNMGEVPHASIQGFLVRVLGNNEDAWAIRVLPEQRVQTSELHYRVADICVVRRATGYEPIIGTAPLLCIEILSREDRMSEMNEKVEDYLGMGVTCVWVLDPRRHKAYQAVPDSLLKAASESLTVPETEISIPVAEIFAQLDWMQPAK